MKLLHIDSSILGDNSASRQLSREVVEAWKAAEPGIEVVYRDLAADAISHFSAATLVAAGTPSKCAMPPRPMKPSSAPRPWKNSWPPTRW